MAPHFMKEIPGFLQRLRSNDESVLNDIAKTRPLFTMVYDLLDDYHDRFTAIQDTLCAVWDDRFTFNDEAHLHRYVRLVARNKIFDILRKDKNSVLKRADSIELIPEIADEVVNYTEIEASFIEWYSEAFRRLSVQERKVIRLLRYYNYTDKDIAERLNIDVSTVQTYKYRAFNKMKGKNKGGNNSFRKFRGFLFTLLILVIYIFLKKVESLVAEMTAFNDL